MERFPRILVLSPTPTWPLDHGNRKRVYSVCQALKNNGAEIDFLYYPAEHDWRQSIPRNALEKMRLQWGTVFVIPPSRPLHTAAQDIDHTIDEWWDPAIGNYLDWLFSIKQYDALFVNYTWLSRALTHAPRCTFKVLDTHDRFSGRRELLARFGIGPEFFHTTDAEEAIAFDRAELVLAIKSQEEGVFRRITKTPVRTLPHMEIGPENLRTHHHSSNRRYLAVGTIGANNSINVVNLKRFLDTALPIFEKYMAPLKIVVAGGQCDGIEKIYPQNFVGMQGRVRNVDLFYDAIDVVIAPMEFSTGLKIKVCEALARSVAIVSHKHAFEGYPPCHPAHECASFEEMAMQLVQLSFNPDGISDLQKASVLAAQQTGNQFEGTLHNIIKRSIVQRTTIIIVIPPGFANKRSYTYHGLMSAAKYLRYAARLIFYVPVRSDVSDAFLEQELEPFGNVFRETEAQCGLTALRKQMPLCAAIYWDLPSEEEIKALEKTAIWMRTDAADQAGKPIDEEAIVARLHGRNNVSVLDCANDRAARIAARLRATPEVVPFFYEAPKLQSPRCGAVLLCNEAQMNLAHAIAGFIEAELPKGESITLCLASEGCILPTYRDTSILLATIHQDLGRTPVGARVVVDLTGGHAAFAIVRESMRRHRVPEIQLSPASSMNAARWDRPRTTTEFLTAIRTACSTAGVSQREHVNDEGWARLWKRAEWATNVANL